MSTIRCAKPLNKKLNMDYLVRWHEQQLFTRPCLKILPRNLDGPAIYSWIFPQPRIKMNKSELPDIVDVLGGS